MVTALIVATTLFVLSVVGNVLLYRAVIAQLERVEKHEDIIRYQTEFFNQIKQMVYESRVRLDAIDTLGAFEADDEVGYFFKQLKDVQEMLDNYTLPTEANAETEKQ